MSSMHLQIRSGSTTGVYGFRQHPPPARNPEGRTIDVKTINPRARLKNWIGLARRPVLRSPTHKLDL